MQQDREEIELPKRCDEGQGSADGDVRDYAASSMFVERDEVVSDGPGDGKPSVVQTGITCERCFLGKVKCSRESPCTRCLRLNLVCKPHFTRPGRPRGSARYRAGSNSKRSLSRRARNKPVDTEGIKSEASAYPWAELPPAQDEPVNHTTEWLDELLMMGALTDDTAESSGGMGPPFSGPPPDLAANTIPAAAQAVPMPTASSTSIHLTGYNAPPSPPALILDPRRPTYPPPPLAQRPPLPPPPQPLRQSPHQYPHFVQQTPQYTPRHVPVPSPPLPVSLPLQPPPVTTQASRIVITTNTQVRRCTDMLHPQQQQRQPWHHDGSGGGSMGVGIGLSAAGFMQPPRNKTPNPRDAEARSQQVLIETRHYSNTPSTASTASGMQGRVIAWFESSDSAAFDKERASAVLLAWHWHNLQLGSDGTLGMLEPLCHALRLPLPPQLPGTVLPYNSLEDELVSGRLPLLFEGLTSLHAMCCVRWCRGRANVTTTDRFTSVFLPTSDLEEAMVTKGLSPLQIWTRLLDGEASVDAYWDTVLRAVFSGGRMENTARDIEVIDRFGWRYTVSARLSLYASPSGWYSYSVLVLGPPQ